jgi:3-hydroxyacyl-[acyl-carrier-protein] dehydratase
MSRITDEILECMSDYTAGGDGKFSARFNFPVGFIGFRGHFPGQPVLPGVCKIQAVLVMVEQLNGEKQGLKEVVQAKYFAPVTCDQELFFECTKRDSDSSEVIVKALVTSDGKKVAQFSLKVVSENMQQKGNERAT